MLINKIITYSKQKIEEKCMRENFTDTRKMQQKTVYLTAFRGVGTTNSRRQVTRKVAPPDINKLPTSFSILPHCLSVKIQNF